MVARTSPRAQPETGSARKARGAFFTPAELADFIAGWAIRSAADIVLEPSCGEAAMLLAAGRRLRALGGIGLLQGMDIDAPSIAEAGKVLDAEGLSADLAVADFFDVAPHRSIDAVVGNPPYIRYQTFSGTDRAKAQRAALAQGVRLGGLANAWAAFVVHASQFLKDNGRLALVLPAALLSVNYAAPVRRFLLARFAKVKLVLFDERVFPGVQEEVVLLLAEGRGPTPKFDLFQVRDLAGLGDIAGLPTGRARKWAPVDADAKWTEALLSSRASEEYTAAVDSGGFHTLSAWGETDLGMVTGNNAFFTLSAETARRLRLRESELLRISPPGSRHLRGLAFGEVMFSEMSLAGARVYLFNPDRRRPSVAAQRYIAQGEADGVHLAYKCAVREPWWKVPSVRIPDLFLTYMNQDVPRLVSNDVRAAHLNSIHGVTLRAEHRKIGQETLPLAMLNSVTMLGAELVGRSYGGGVLKIEPREASTLPLPAAETLHAVASRLKLLKPQLAPLFRSSQLADVVAEVDRVVLVDALGMTPSSVRFLRAARDALAHRRAARAGRGAQT